MGCLVRYCCSCSSVHGHKMQRHWQSVIMSSRILWCNVSFMPPSYQFNIPCALSILPTTQRCPKALSFMLIPILNAHPHPHSSILRETHSDMCTTTHNADTTAVAHAHTDINGAAAIVWSLHLLSPARLSGVICAVGVRVSVDRAVERRGRVRSRQS